MKRLQIRLNDKEYEKLLDLINKFDGDSFSDRFRRFIEKLAEKQGVSDFSLSNEFSDSVSQQAQKEVPCPALINIPKKGYACANKAPKITILPSLLICQFCWERQQKLKTTSTQPTAVTMYKKSNDLYCIKDGYWLNPQKIQVKCENCKLNEFRKWAECQRHNSLIKQKGGSS